MDFNDGFLFFVLGWWIGGTNWHGFNVELLMGFKEIEIADNNI